MARGKFGRRMGFGQQPAVLVIDAQRYMVGTVEDETSWPSSCGEVGREAMRHIAQIVQTAQKVEVPCIFTRFEIDPSGADMGVYRRKRDLLDSDRWCLAGIAYEQPSLIVRRLITAPSCRKRLCLTASQFHMRFLFLIWTVSLPMCCLTLRSLTICQRVRAGDSTRVFRPNDAKQTVCARVSS